MIMNFPKSIFIDVLTESGYVDKYSDNVRKQLIENSTQLSRIGRDIGFPVISVLTSLKPYTYLRETAVAPFAEFSEDNDESIEGSFNTLISSGYYLFKDNISDYFINKMSNHKDFKVILFSAEKGHFTKELIRSIGFMDIFYNTIDLVDDIDIINTLGLKYFKYTDDMSKDHSILYNNLLNKHNKPPIIT